MKLIPSLKAISLPTFAVLLLASCSPLQDPNASKPEEVKNAETKNPHPAGSYAAFKWKNYPGTTRTWKNESLLAKANPSNSKIKINIGDQRGFLIVDDLVAMDYRVSTGRRGKYDTPCGEYHIIEKVKDKRSNLYGKILNAEDEVVNSDADFRIDEVPPGGKFLGSPMLYWMRLTNDGIGMHKGNVNSRYASHGCIRSHYSAVPIIFDKTRIGTSVSVQP